MKKSSFLALALAPMILGTPMAFGESVSTDPVGFVKIDLDPGLQAVGLPMVKPAVAAGRVASSNASSVTMEAEVGSLPAGAYYLEVVSGAGEAPWVGDRFEVTGSAGAVVSINTTSPRNTVSLGSVDLAGYSVVVRPHLTLNEAFPPAGLTEGDQILTFNPDTGGFNVVTLEDDIFGGGLTWQENLVLNPGLGMFYRNVGAAKNVVNLGEVRMNNFRQPLGQGLNLISEGHPIDSSPSSRQMTAANGFEAGDQILVFNPGTGGFNVVTLEDDIFGGGLVWQDDSNLLVANASVFVRKTSADPDYEAPKTF
jgi:hypothetical protein